MDVFQCEHQHHHHHQQRYDTTGADITTKDNKGKTPLQWAQINRHAEVGSLLDDARRTTDYDGKKAGTGSGGGSGGGGGGDGSDPAAK